jgi:hypothetical protein
VIARLGVNLDHILSFSSLVVVVSVRVVFCMMVDIAIRW